MRLNLRSNSRNTPAPAPTPTPTRKQRRPPRPADPLADTPSPTNSTAPTQATPRLTVFRKHFVEDAQITEIRDLRTGVSEFRGRSSVKYVMDDFNEIQKMGEFLVNVSALSSSYRQGEWKGLYGEERHCQCERSGCRQNYCVCFQGGFRCGDFCLCSNCKNVSVGSSPSGEGGVGRRGSHYCRCKRSENCQKSYCGCLRLGINCSKQCSCENCEN